MRVAWLVILMVSVGCRNAPETASGLRANATISSAKPLPVVTRAVPSNSNVVPVAFLPKPSRDIRGNGRDSSNVDSRQPALQDNTHLQGEVVVPVVSMSLTLDAAVQTALEQNPDLIAIRYTEPVARAVYGVAKTYPFNPQFQTQVLPYTRDRNGNGAPVNQQHVLVQTFELAHQRRFRAGVAEAQWEQVRGIIRAAELLGMAQTERFFFAALYQRDLRDLAQSLAIMNEHLVGVLERRLNAGQSKTADVALARLQAQSARRQQWLMEANYRTALRSLISYLNLPEGTEVNLVGQWLDWQWKPVADALRTRNNQSSAGRTAKLLAGGNSRILEAELRQLVTNRPDVAAARAGVAMALENLALAQALRTPNLQIGPMWQRDDAATEFWGVQGQMNIPIVNTGKPLVQQRRAELQQLRAMATQLEERAVLEARAAVRRYEQARWLVEQSRVEFAQTMPNALKIFEDQFKAGQITVLEVFAARTSLTQSRQSILDLLNELTQAMADVTLATGLPAQQLILTPPTAPRGVRIVPIP